MNENSPIACPACEGRPHRNPNGCRGCNNTGTVTGTKLEDLDLLAIPRARAFYQENKDWIHVVLGIWATFLIILILNLTGARA